MGPSCGRKTRPKSAAAARRKSLSKNQVKSDRCYTVSPAKSPVKPASQDPSNVDSSKGFEYNNDLSCNSVCLTPKAKKCRIPEMNTCPPAPKKRRIMVTGGNSSLRRTTTTTSTTTPVSFFAHPDIEVFFYFALRGISV